MWSKKYQALMNNLQEIVAFYCRATIILALNK